MRKIREMLRLHYEMGMSMRAIACSLSVSHSTVSDLLKRVKVLGLSWPLGEDLNDATLEALLYSGNTGKSRKRPNPTGITFTKSFVGKGSHSNSFGLSTRSVTLTATSTRSSVSATASGGVNST